MKEVDAKKLADELAKIAQAGDIDCYIFVGIHIVSEEPRLKLSVTSFGNRRDHVKNKEAVLTVSQQNVEEVIRLMFNDKKEEPPSGLLN